MTTTKYDYDSLEREYVQGDMSIRQLCRDHDIPTFSTVAMRAKRYEWDAKRAIFTKKLKEAESAVVIAKRTDVLSRAIDDAVMVANKAIFAFLDSLTDRWVETPTGERIIVPAQIISASDFVKITDRLVLLSGQPTKREAFVGLNVDVDSADLSMEVLRDIISIARDQGVDAGPASESPLPRSKEARPLN